MTRLRCETCGGWLFVGSMDNAEREGPPRPCPQCGGGGVRRITYHSEPDERGRRSFTLEWPDASRPAGRRAQCFRTDPAPYLARWEHFGFTFEVVDETAA